MKPSHGTQMASKAVGKKFGLAKEVKCPSYTALLIIVFSQYRLL
jgi:hypothetical protein